VRPSGIKSLAPTAGGRRTASGLAEDRPLRRDAELNLGRILEAARDLFAELGYEASMEQIASRAGVGVGTLYRRFPTKEDLLGAVTVDAMDRVRLLAEEVARTEAPDQALFVFLRRCVALPTSWRAISTRTPWPGAITQDLFARAGQPVEQLIAHAKQVGAVRPDVTHTDVSLALMSIRAVADRCGVIGSPAWQRTLELLLDGLRPRGTELPGSPMTRAQMYRMLTGR
jgi:AcrR family transcriptional regulator